MGMQIETFHLTEEPPPKAPTSQEIQMTARASIAAFISHLEHPFNVPIELYVSLRDPAVMIPEDGTTFEPMDTFMHELFEPLRWEISHLLYSCLGTTVLDASFHWAYLGHSTIIPTIFIGVPPKTVADWAELESSIRRMLGKAISRLGVVIDVQFQIVYPFAV